MSNDADAERMERTDAVQAVYDETETERLLAFRRSASASRDDGATLPASIDGFPVVVAQNRDGYAMLKVRDGVDGDELERYYGFDMALDHVGELLGVDPFELPIPGAASDMGM
ncbi:hypothetical protein OB905_04385 [Halobacteria archaeon AArc-dxtr1]|nr:hypothetical protein [Halobacteria archaeon AArc-dxtr1]